MKHVNEKSFLTLRSLGTEADQRSWKPRACTLWKMDAGDLYCCQCNRTGCIRHSCVGYKAGHKGWGRGSSVGDVLLLFEIFY